MDYATATPGIRAVAPRRSYTLVTEVVWAAAALAIIAVIGGLKLFLPFDGDQALFFYMAREIDRGQTLYVDVWDLKQPGIFWFYWLGGKLFGFSMFGIKLFELAWLLAFAATLILCLRRYLVHAWLGGVAAVAAIGSYYTFSGAQELTQLEMLVSFPMFLSLWLLVREPEASAAAFVCRLLSGALAGVCVVFKLPYAPIFILLVVLAIVDTAPSRRLGALLRHGVAVLVPYTLGVTAILGATCVVLWRQGSLDELLWISFVFPFLSLEYAPSEAPLGRLVRNLKWYGVTLAPWLAFACVPLLRLFRRDEPPLTRQMIGWIAVAVLLIALQLHSFWRYHFFLLFVPGAVLAARGIDLILSRLEAMRPAPGAASRPLSALLLGALLVLPALGSIVYNFDRQVQNFYQALYSAQRVGLDVYRQEMGKDYGWAARWFDPTRFPAGREPIYVLGNPLVYLVTGRPQALPIHGWSWEMLPPEYWRDLPAQLAEARPAYVLLGRFYRRLFPERQPYGPQIIQFLNDTYDVVWDDPAVGVLYRRRTPPADTLPVADAPPVPDFRAAPVQGRPVPNGPRELQPWSLRD